MRLLNFSVRSFLFGLILFVMPAASFSQVFVSVRFGPPALPVYEQPLCPGEGYIWTPGYWAWGGDFDDYYWVPGTWVLAPEPGFLWTPAWWGWGGSAFVFHEGFWGPHVGFYGGINYGFGYFGEGFAGGRWDHDRFYYNRSVTNVNITNIHNVYNETVINNTTNRVSYNGGEGGINARPTQEQERWSNERHIPPVAEQHQHMQEARSNQQLRASVNQGRPPIAATPRPAEFNRPGVVAAREAGAPYKPANRNENQPRGNEGSPRPGNNAPRSGNFVHPRDLPPAERWPAPNTGNPKMDKKYQAQQEKQFAKQQQQRDKLQARQDKQDQRLAQKNASDARRQQMEQRHQQQTQQLQQRHEQQRQAFQQRTQRPPQR